MLEKLDTLAHLIGNTPIVQLSHDKINLFAKLEFYNLMNSIKARAAFRILRAAIVRGEVTERSTVIESSSGNFATAMATLCKYIGIRFIAVIDPNINSTYENILRNVCQVEKVTERDETGGFLKTRLAKVQELLMTVPDAYWTNQYENPDNFETHYHGTGAEIAAHFEQLDYLFVGVSTGGTISGLSHRVKEAFPSVKVIAVDTQGSIIFGGQPKKRYIPGIGASIKPALVKRALIDDVVIVPEVKTVEGCHDLYTTHAVFAGGSSGTSYYAIQQYFQDKQFDRKPNVVFLCPDNGAAYTNTVYNPEWVAWLKEQEQELAYV